LNYYPHHIGDYSKDTAHLTILEDGAYRRMLDLYYSSERPLPKNRDGLYRLLRARSKEEKSAVDTVLAEFFHEDEYGWRNARADSEISKAQEKGMKAKRSAELRWQSERNANASRPDMRTHSDGNAPNNQEPIANNQEPKREQRQQRSRGSRLPPDWEPSEILKAWASKERPDLDPRVTLERFRDYWASVPGGKGLKLDWDATFRNWTRAERAGSKPKEIDFEALTKRLEEQERASAGI
jgi:uncharacterized protein YdaU (DUF1376 family)